MFFKNSQPAPVPELIWSVEPQTGASSPTPSIAPSLAPSTVSSQSRSSFFGGFGRRDSAALPIPTPAYTSLKIGLTMNEMAKELQRLQDQCTQWEQQSKVNQDMLHGCAARLQDKEQECEDLERENQSLNDELEAMAGMKKVLEAGFREKDVELQKASEQLQIAQGTNYVDANKYTNMQRSLKDTQERVDESQRGNQGKDEKLSKLRLENIKLRCSCTALEEAVVYHKGEASVHQNHAEKLEVEKGVLAMRSAELDRVVQQSKKLIGRLEKQLHSISDAHHQQVDDKDKALGTL